MKKKTIIFALILFGTVLCSCSSQEEVTKEPAPEPPAVKLPILEGYPVRFIESLENKERELVALTHNVNRSQASAIVSASRTWKPGKTITVAFKGGSVDLRRQIAEAVRPWSGAANLVFDFGYSPQTGNYREWSPADTTYKAEIRIAFDGGSEGGYWSAVGRDSINRTFFRPGVASMNLEGFTEELLEDWQATLLHEFGHAIGFEHEHQSPNSSCEQEYRWDDDPGYIPTLDQFQQFVRDNQGRRPGIYTVLVGAPNRWDIRQIDFNLKKFANSTDWFLTQFDRLSIMKYHFDSWMFRDLAASTTSGCYSPPSSVLSVEDQRAALAVYPRSPSDVKAVTDERADISRDIVLRPDISSTLKEQFRSNLK